MSPQTPGPYTRLFSELVHAEIALWDSLENHLRQDVGVTVAQYQSLLAVGSIPAPVRVQDISAEMAITVGATSKLVDRLELAGHVTRNSNPADRRSSVIELTDAGSELLTRAAAAVEHHVSGAIGAVFSESRAAAFTTELSDLRVAAGAEVAA